MEHDKNLIITALVLSIIGIGLLAYGFATPKYEVGDCFPLQKFGKIVEYDEKNRTLTAFVKVNCCGVVITVEKKGDTYRIIEKQHGELCRCECVREVKIYDVPKGSKVEFVNKDGVVTFTSIAGFCGWSTYGKCESDEDCVIDGCSGQVCRSKFEEPVITTCEWLDCYDVKGVACKCIDGKCQWITT